MIDIEAAAKTAHEVGAMVVVGNTFVSPYLQRPPSEEEAVEIVGRTQVWTLAESLGGVESLIEHPAQMTHASTAEGPFAAPRNLIRLSVGIEPSTT